MLTNNSWYRSSKEISYQTSFNETIFNSADEIISQFTESGGIESVFNDMLKQMSQPHLFCWFLPLIKTFSEFETYFTAMVRTTAEYLCKTFGNYLA